MLFAGGGRTILLACRRIWRGAATVWWCMGRERGVVRKKKGSRFRSMVTCISWTRLWQPQDECMNAFVGCFALVNDKKMEKRSEPLDYLLVVEQASVIVPAPTTASRSGLAGCRGRFPASACALTKEGWSGRFLLLNVDLKRLVWLCV